MLFSIDSDMPLLASLFGIGKSKPSTPKPAGKRRASPLKDSPIQSDEDDESSASDYIMGETKDDKKPKSDRQEEEYIPMEQVDYDRDSDSDEDKKPSEPPLEERPRQAQPSMTLDEETESDNVKHHHEERPPLPRGPTMKAPLASLEQSKWVGPNKPEQIGIKLLRDTANPSPFWNHKFLSIVTTVSAAPSKRNIQNSTMFQNICKGPVTSHAG